MSLIEKLWSKLYSWNGENWSDLINKSKKSEKFNKCIESWKF